MKCDALFSFLKSSKFDEKRISECFHGIFFWPKYRVYLKNESLSLKMTLVGLNESPKSHGILETKQNCWPK